METIKTNGAQETNTINQTNKPQTTVNKGEQKMEAIKTTGDKETTKTKTTTPRKTTGAKGAIKTKTTTNRKTTGAKGVQTWQNHLRPLRKLIEIQLTIQELKPLGVYSKTLHTELTRSIKRSRDLLLKTDIKIPRRLKGRMEKALS